MVHKTNFNHFSGEVAKPFEGAPLDTEIHIGQCVFVPNDPIGVYHVEDMSHYRGTLLSVHFATSTWSSVEGSAVMVAPGIALTAFHVIDNLISHITASELEIFCTGLTPNGLRLWRVRQMTRCDGTDLMILSLAYASPIPQDGQFDQTTMTTRLPPIGETIMIAGFRASGEYVPWENETFAVKNGHLSYCAGIRTGVGVVTQHLLGGGRMVGGPVIEVACSTVGGMSGGPAFDKDGNVIGILSTGIDAPEGRGPSQVSLLWPALTATIIPAFLIHLFPDPARLLDVDLRFCGIEGRSAVRYDFERGCYCVDWDNVSAGPSGRHSNP